MYVHIVGVERDWIGLDWIDWIGLNRPRPARHGRSSRGPGASPGFF